MCYRKPARLFVSLTLFLFVFKPESAPADGKNSLTGPDFSQWRESTGEWQVAGDAFMRTDDIKRLGTTAGTGVLINGAAGRTVNLLSKEEFGDQRLHAEFMVPGGSNSGVYFMGRYEVQVLDSWGVDEPKYSDCGGIYQRWDEDREPRGYEGHPPRVNAAFPPGRWQTFDVIFRAPRFDESGRKIENARFVRVIHNGIIVHENVALTGPTRASTFADERPVGPLMLQGDHGPVAYRNIRVWPISRNDFFAMDTGTKDAHHRTAADQAKMLRALAYDGIDHTGCDHLAEKLYEVEQRGLRLFAVYLDVWIDKPEKKYNTNLPEAIKILKGRETVLWLPLRSEQHKPSSPAGDEMAVAIVREIADMAAESGLRVALYPHYNFWLERVEDAVRLTKKVNRENVGVTINLCHLLRVGDEGNIKERIKSALPRLFMVTINGADHTGGWNELIQPLGSGEFDVYTFVKALRMDGYTGPIGLQGYGIGGDIYENLRRSIKAWREINARYHAQSQ